MSKRSADNILSNPKTKSLKIELNLFRDVLTYITDYLRFEDRLSFSQTCKSARKFKPKIHRVEYYSGGEVNGYVVSENKCGIIFGTNSKEKKIKVTFGYSRPSDIIVIHLFALEQIKLGSLLENMIKVKYGNIKSLRIECDMVDLLPLLKIWKILELFPNLEVLDIVNCHRTIYFDRTGMVKKLRIHNIHGDVTIRPSCDMEELFFSSEQQYDLFVDQRYSYGRSCVIQKIHGDHKVIRRCEHIGGKEEPSFTTLNLEEGPFFDV